MPRSALFGETLTNYLGVANYAASLDSTGKVPAAQIPIASPLSGAMVQMVGISVQGFTTTTGVHAGGFDNVPIGSAEGSTFGLSINLKPTSASNKIYVQGMFFGSSSIAVTAGIFYGLFLAASSSAVIAGGDNGLITNDMAPLGFLWQATTVSTATTNYAVRLGSTGAAGTFTLNGQSGAGVFGNTIQSSLTVWEVKN